MVKQDESTVFVTVKPDLDSEPVKLSDDGLKFLMVLESVEKDMYFDSAGLPTIGVGHLLSEFEYENKVVNINSDYVSFVNGLTYEQCMRLLEFDIVRYEEAVNELVKVSLSQNQYDALVIFIYNIGVNAFKNSTLLKKLNESEYDEVPDQLMRWVFVKGQKSIGLRNRRKAEVNVWSNGKYNL